MGHCDKCNADFDNMEEHNKDKHAEGGEAAPSGGDAPAEPAAEDKPAEGGGGEGGDKPQ